MIAWEASETFISYSNNENLDCFLPQKTTT